ncbi:mannitol-1-phosphate 5-dehydrogenase [Pontibacillus yanchengensis]|uniref:Mannitol-1-phosphate 5-dehydrogenase n=1 Tax=Pontibacillus yanchengensis Y32 TaxID=1385514 RepID=A0A0A2TYX2_9BACI|nr:mannitol-1-phosphate 5-dehydrogenase [Pontibacillus yanchengensis]KGP74465.1 mannitol dehydrogenase [Pontibacillus yanchengensis Y32]
MKALHFGGGNIGRGLIGYVLHQNGFEICFVDANQQVVDDMNHYNNYQVKTLDQESTVETISPARALHVSSQSDVINKIIESDIITTSVGVNNLPKVAPIIAKGLLERIRLKEKKIDIIANENAINATSTLRGEIEKNVSEREMETIQSYVGFPNSAIDRLSLSEERNGRDVAVVEPYYEWVVNESELVNPEISSLNNVTYVESLTPYIERKLFLVNLGHATTAFLAFLEGYQTIQSALKDSRMEEFLRETLNEVSRYFVQTYHVPNEEMTEFIEETIKRFKNEQISDDIFRVGRAPIRKLSYNERLVKPLRSIYELGLPIENVTTAIAAGFLFDNPDDEESVQIQSFIKEYGIEEAISHFTQIEDTTLKTKIKNNYERLKEGNALGSLSER